MAVLDITEYDRIAADGSGARILAGLEPRRVNQQLAPGPVSAVSQPFGDSTLFVRLHSDTTLRFEVGVAPVATGASPRLVAGGTEFLGVRPGHRIAVIESV